MARLDRRETLIHLRTSELAAIARSLGVLVQHDGLRERLVESLAETDHVTLGQILMELSRRRLKELCRARGLDDSGRDKLSIVTRLIGIDPHRPPEPRAVPPIRRAKPRT